MNVIVPGRLPGAMTLILLKDKSMSRTFAVSDRSFDPMDVIELLATVTLTKVAYCGNPGGTAVS